MVLVGEILTFSSNASFLKSAFVTWNIFQIVRHPQLQMEIVLLAKDWDIIGILTRSFGLMWF